MQQLFRLLIFLNQPNMFRATNSPILRSTFWLYIQLLAQCTDTAAAVSVHCTNSCIHVQSNVLLRMGKIVAQNILSWFKKNNKRKICCILLFIYIVVQNFMAASLITLPTTLPWLFMCLRNWRNRPRASVSWVVRSEISTQDLKNIK